MVYVKSQSFAARLKINNETKNFEIYSAKKATTSFRG
jgi:hypothetical protein